MSHPLAVFHQYRTSPTRFVFVCAAAMVTLGGFWRMPYLLVTYGGSAFLLVYLAALLLMGLPILSAQVFLAKGTRTDLLGVIDAWTRSRSLARCWRGGALLALLGVFLLLAAYAVVASWLLAYDFRAVGQHLTAASVDRSSAGFLSFVSDGERGMGWLLLFVVLLVGIVGQGFRRGVEPVLQVLFGVLFALLVVLLVVLALQVPTSRIPLELFSCDFSALGLRGVCEAFYQAFFALSLGTGVVLALSARLPAQVHAVRLSVAVVVISQIMAGMFACLLLMIVPAEALKSISGLQWLFEVLPTVAQPAWVLSLVFLLLWLAAIAAGAGLMETLVQFLERRARLTRIRATVYAGVAVVALGLVAQNAFGSLASWKLFGDGVFGWLAMASTNWILPIIGLGFAVMVSAILARKRLQDAWGCQASPTASGTFFVWYAMLSYSARLGLVVVLAYALGVVNWIQEFWGFGP